MAQGLHLSHNNPVLQGYPPAIQLFSTQDLQRQAEVTAAAEAGYSAVALSSDGELLAACADQPDLELSVWHWRKVGHRQLLLIVLQHILLYACHAGQQVLGSE